MREIAIGFNVCIRISEGLTPEDVKLDHHHEAHTYPSMLYTFRPQTLTDACAHGSQCAHLRHAESTDLSERLVENQRVQSLLNERGDVDRFWLQK